MIKIYEEVGKRWSALGFSVKTLDIKTLEELNAQSCLVSAVSREEVQEWEEPFLPRRRKD